MDINQIFREAKSCTLRECIVNDNVQVWNTSGVIDNNSLDMLADTNLLTDVFTKLDPMLFMGSINKQNTSVYNRVMNYICDILSEYDITPREYPVIEAALAKISVSGDIPKSTTGSTLKNVLVTGGLLLPLAAVATERYFRSSDDTKDTKDTKDTTNTPPEADKKDDSYFPYLSSVNTDTVKETVALTGLGAAIYNVSPLLSALTVGLGTSYTGYQAYKGYRSDYSIESEIKEIETIFPEYKNDHKSEIIISIDKQWYTTDKLTTLSDKVKKEKKEYIQKAKKYKDILLKISDKIFNMVKTVFKHDNDNELFILTEYSKSVNQYNIDKNISTKPENFSTKYKPLEKLNNTDMLTIKNTFISNDTDKTSITNHMVKNGLFFYYEYLYKNINYIQKIIYESVNEDEMNEMNEMNKITDPKSIILIILYNLFVKSNDLTNKNSNLYYMFPYIYGIKLKHFELEYCIKKLEKPETTDVTINKCKNVLSTDILTSIFLELKNDDFNRNIDKDIINKFKQRLNKEYISIFINDKNEIKVDSIHEKLKKFNDIHRDTYKTSTNTSMKRLAAVASGIALSYGASKLAAYTGTYNRNDVDVVFLSKFIRAAVDRDSPNNLTYLIQTSKIPISLVLLEIIDSNKGYSYIQMLDKWYPVDKDFYSNVIYNFGIALDRRSHYTATALLIYTRNLTDFYNLVTIAYKTRSNTTLQQIFACPRIGEHYSSLLISDPTSELTTKFLHNILKLPVNPKGYDILSHVYNTLPNDVRMSLLTKISNDKNDNIRNNMLLYNVSGYDNDTLFHKLGKNNKMASELLYARKY